MNEIVVTGMVISVMPVGEYDRRVEILSSELGRITAFARGARKPGSQLVSATRSFSFGQFSLYQGKNSYTLMGASISNYFDKLVEDLDAACYGFYFLELAQYFSREGVESSEMLKLLYYSLKALSLTAVSNKLVRCIYELRMLAVNGLCPTLDRLMSGYGIYAFAANMSSSCQRAYAYVLEMPTEKLFTFKLSDECLEEYETIVRHLIRQSVDKKFKSLSIIDDIL